jgi:hypothetical protein
MIHDGFVARLFRGEAFLLSRITADRMGAQQKEVMRDSETIA